MIIEAVLFDFGGVFTGSPFEAIRAGSAEFGVDADVLLELVFGPYDRDTDHPWHQLERGELTLGAAREQLVALAAEQGLDIDPFKVLRSTVIGGGTADVWVDRGKRLRAEGYRTALVTNNIAEFSDGWRSLVPVDELFEIVIDSCKVGIRKPDPRIFHLALEGLGGVAPERTVFLDDFQGNVDAARSLGMAAILVGNDRAAAVEELDALLAGSAP